MVSWEDDGIPRRGGGYDLLSAARGNEETKYEDKDRLRDYLELHLKLCRGRGVFE